MQFSKSIFILSVYAMLLPSFAWALYPAEVPRTGQTKCYNETGDNISCAGTGQDGDWLAGVPWPAPRFIDNSDGTVSDKMTGLEWTKNANPAGDNMTWQQALDYVKTLNTGGHTDWRLPNINELESLVDAQLYAPALPQNHPFTNAQSNIYWSSTSYLISPGRAWVVDINYGYVYYGLKTGGSHYVWPVRSGQCGSLDNSVLCLPKTGQTACYSDNDTIIDCAGTGQDGERQAGVAWPDPRFIDNGDGTVTDKLTGLEWAKDANMAGGKYWRGALKFVNTLALGGHRDWRLPNKNELRSLVDYSIPMDSPFTNNSSLTFYWTSTSNATSPSFAWNMFMGGGLFIDFFDEFYLMTKKTNKISNSCFVWPVRSGQVVPARPCLATRVMGADNPDLETLRVFRDSKLAQSAVGRKLIQIYYHNADTINAVLDKSPVLRALAGRVLEMIVPMVSKN